MAKIFEPAEAGSKEEDARTGDQNQPGKDHEIE